MSDVIDLDILKPEKKIIKLNGKEFDVSFIPLGITFEVDDLVTQLSKFTKEELTADTVKMKEALSVMVRLCSAFTSFKYPDMDEGWFSNNCSPEQVNGFAQAIKDSLARSYKGVEDYGKN